MPESGHTEGTACAKACRQLGGAEEGCCGVGRASRSSPPQSFLGECFLEREVIVTLHAGMLDSQAASDSPRVSLWVKGTLVWSPDFLSLTCHI